MANTFDHQTPSSKPFASYPLDQLYQRRRRWGLQWTPRRTSVTRCFTTSINPTTDSPKQLRLDQTLKSAWWSESYTRNWIHPTLPTIIQKKSRGHSVYWHTQTSSSETMPIPTLGIFNTLFDATSPDFPAKQPENGGPTTKKWSFASFLLHGSLSFYNSPSSSSPRRARPNIFAALKKGDRNLLLAVVDHGITSFLVWSFFIRVELRMVCLISWVVHLAICGDWFWWNTVDRRNDVNHARRVVWMN